MIIVVFNHFELMSFPRIFQTKNASILLGLLEATPFFSPRKMTYVPMTPDMAGWLRGWESSREVGFGVVVAKLGKVDSTKNWVDGGNSNEELESFIGDLTKITVIIP